MFQDISYYGCIEISGPQFQIIEAMTYVTNQDAGNLTSGGSKEVREEGSRRVECWYLFFVLHQNNLHQHLQVNTVLDKWS